MSQDQTTPPAMAYARLPLRNFIPTDQQAGRQLIPEMTETVHNRCWGLEEDLRHLDHARRSTELWGDSFILLGLGGASTDFAIRQVPIQERWGAAVGGLTALWGAYVRFVGKPSYDSAYQAMLTEYLNQCTEEVERPWRQVAREMITGASAAVAREVKIAGNQLLEDGKQTLVPLAVGAGLALGAAYYLEFKDSSVFIRNWQIAGQLLCFSW